MSEFNFKSLGLEVGDDVLVANDSSKSDFTYAKIVRVKDDPNAQAIDAVSFANNGIRKFTQCWHRDDPRIITHRDKFTTQGAGIFVLTEGCKRAKALHKKVADLEQRVATLDAKLAELSMPIPTEADIRLPARTRK